MRITGRRDLSTHWFRLELVTVEQLRADGTHQMIEREVYHNGPGATVLPVDRARGTVLLTRQLRVPALVNDDDPTLVEACAGIVDNDDPPDETARREALEELGVRLGAVRRLFALYTSPGASAEIIHYFLADYTPADRVERGGGLAGEGEDIGVIELTLDEAARMVETGAIVDAKTVLLLAAARAA